VKIGDGAIVGASSVVTKDIESYSVVAGNPARVNRKRFDEETIEKLLKIEWWNWEIQRIRESLPLLISDRVRKFVEKNHPSTTFQDRSAR
jgi:acyl-[acyl carrier protein]--UDP-N-acetylglucosamine O-acyltransferase